jgi:hypothetical protein
MNMPAQHKSARSQTQKPATRMSGSADKDTGKPEHKTPGSQGQKNHGNKDKKDW